MQESGSKQIFVTDDVFLKSLQLLLHKQAPSDAKSKSSQSSIEVALLYTYSMIQRIVLHHTFSWYICSMIALCGQHRKQESIVDLLSVLLFETIWMCVCEILYIYIYIIYI